ncbi:hypothetical protein FA95DRAFT_592040 [Auriscalpium vulgare]|uniref:Uncharacterized protein n=1 Tax=Auriscalpium vulgare TaxID=40419 RepID=A0ACB8S3R8_9AGAM|nr:hypothetical protein FA95DRAFT_592040 [Auriscalpium vulgare]
MAVPPRTMVYAGSDKSGATAVFVFALLSTLAVSLVLIRAAYVALHSMLWRRDANETSREAFFFRSQLGQYALCLLISNWLSSIGGMIEIDWITTGAVVTGSSCTAQGVLTQMGQFGSSYFIVAMGIHTFNSLVLRNRQPHWVGITIIALGVFGALAIGAIPAAVSDSVSGPLYAVVGLDCGVSRNYPVAHMLLYFLPIYLAAFLSTIFYSLIFLVLRGTLTINGGLKFKLNPQYRWRAQSGDFEEYQRFVSSIARSLLWFPTVYSFCMLPSSVVQLMDISGSPASVGAMSFALILVHINGVLNVLILINVLRVLGPAVRANSSSFMARSGDIEKNGSAAPAVHAAFAPRSIPRKTSRVPPPKPERQGSLDWRSSPFVSHHRANSSVDSTSRLLTPVQEHARSASAASMVSASSLQRKISPLADTILAPPPAAAQKEIPVVPQLHRLSVTEHSGPGGLPAAPRKMRSPVSREIVSPPQLPESPQDDQARDLFHEAFRPRADSSGSEYSPDRTSSGDGHSSLISMYLSRTSSTNAQLPTFPVNVRESHRGARGLQASASVTAVGGRPPVAPPLPTPPAVTSPALSSPSHYGGTEYASDSDIALSPPPLPPLPTFPRHTPLRTSIDSVRSSRALPTPPTMHSVPRRSLDETGGRPSVPGLHIRKASMASLNTVGRNASVRSNASISQAYGGYL